MPATPVGPAGPVGPVGPCAPCAPCGPVAPSPLVNGAETYQMPETVSAAVPDPRVICIPSLSPAEIAAVPVLVQFCPPRLATVQVSAVATSLSVIVKVRAPPMGLPEDSS